MDAVALSIKQGPVFIGSLAGKGAHNAFYLWDQIVGGEYFPPTEGSAFYLLTLSREVTEAEDVEPARFSLAHALEDLSRTWQFAGGSIMLPYKVQTNIQSDYDDNSSEVKERLLSKVGLKQVNASVTISAEIAATYEGMPLKKAIQLCRSAKEDPRLGELFRYYHNACVERDKWFSDLYKIRDVLANSFGSAKKARTAIAITDDEWGFFEQTLNNYDLRHPGTPGQQALASEDIGRLKRIGYKWISSYISRRG